MVRPRLAGTSGDVHSSRTSHSVTTTSQASSAGIAAALRDTTHEPASAAQRAARSAPPPPVRMGGRSVPRRPGRGAGHRGRRRERRRSAPARCRRCGDGAGNLYRPSPRPVPGATENGPAHGGSGSAGRRGRSRARRRRRPDRGRPGGPCRGWGARGGATGVPRALPARAQAAHAAGHGSWSGGGRCCGPGSMVESPAARHHLGDGRRRRTGVPGLHPGPAREPGLAGAAGARRRGLRCAAPPARDPGGRRGHRLDAAGRGDDG